MTNDRETLSRKELEAIKLEISLNKGRIKQKAKAIELGLKRKNTCTDVGQSK